MSILNTFTPQINKKQQKQKIIMIIEDGEEVREKEMN